MIYDAAMMVAADECARHHLLQHYDKGKLQEDLCFALWRPSTGRGRVTAIIKEVILPQKGERELHGNASFNSSYLSRAIRLACKEGAGLALMHSHPSDGWQDMSIPDITAEQVVIGYPAGVTGLPLVGLTIGTDGYWSARFWVKDKGKKPRRHWCRKVRVIGRKEYRVYYNDNLVPPPARSNILRRTIDSWGRECQQDIARLKVGVVGLGSVGCVVAEVLARIGVSDIVLIDADTVEEHNLDRLLYGTKKDIGKRKVDIVKRAILRNATAREVKVAAHALPVQNKHAYESALDCDFLFSCVDRPVARDVLNHIANAHLVPVVDGGVAVERNSRTEKLNAAHWRAHIITPHHQCMRCNGQYDSSMVVTELDGSLDNPSYINNLPPEQRDRNQNVFSFALHLAGMEVNLMLRYLIGQDWWPSVSQQDYQFVTGKITINNEECLPQCSFRARAGLGDAASALQYLSQDTPNQHPEPGFSFIAWAKNLIKRF